MERSGVFGSAGLKKKKKIIKYEYCIIGYSIISFDRMMLLRKWNIYNNNDHDDLAYGKGWKKKRKIEIVIFNLLHPQTQI